jgi:hypothetical protein
LLITELAVAALNVSKDIGVESFTHFWGWDAREGRVRFGMVNLRSRLSLGIFLVETEGVEL